MYVCLVCLMYDTGWVLSMMVGVYYVYVYVVYAHDGLWCFVLVLLDVGMLALVMGGVRVG